MPSVEKPKPPPSPEVLAYGERLAAEARLERALRTWPNERVERLAAAIEDGELTPELLGTSRLQRELRRRRR